MKYGLLLLSVTFLLLFTACNSNSAVTGKVTYEDGTPLTVGKVKFTNGSITGTATINDKGDYKAGLLKDGEGLPDGAYKVYIIEAMKEDSAYAVKTDEGDTFTPKVLIIDPKFTDPDKSGLTCDVSGKTTFDIKVTKPGPDYNPRVSTGD